MEAEEELLLANDAEIEKDDNNEEIKEEDEEEDEKDVKIDFLESYSVIAFVIEITFRKFKNLALLVLVVSVLDALLVTWEPQILQRVLDSVLSWNENKDNENQERNIWFLLGQMIVCGVLSELVHNFGIDMGMRLSNKVEDYIRGVALNHFFKLPMLWHYNHDSGEVQTILDDGAEAVTYIVSELLTEGVLLAFLRLSVFLFVALHRAPDFWWIFIIPGVFYAVMTYYFDCKEREGYSQYRIKQKKLNSFLFDTLTNVLTIKVFGKEDNETSAFLAQQKDFREVDYALNLTGTARMVTQKLVQNASRFLLIALSFRNIMEGKMTVGTMIMLLEYQRNLLDPIDYLSNIYSGFKKKMKKLADLRQLLETRNTLEDTNYAKDIEPLQERIIFDKVGFHIEDREILRDINFEIEAGKTTAFVGRSGSGKTTSALLLLRIYDPTSGVIHWDSNDLKHSTLKSRSKQITVVTQESNLFNRSIRDNIAYGFPGATMEQIEEAARKASAHDFITKTPQQYQTVVGERGVKLSGGQKQRIAIARALLLKPSLLILDESTSHLDAESEGEIQNAIKQLHHTITQVIIAHRLSTIIHADKIVVFDEGSVIGQGTHEELLASCATYKLLYEKQSKDNTI